MKAKLGRLARMLLIAAVVLLLLTWALLAYVHGQVPTMQGCTGFVGCH